MVNKVTVIIPAYNEEKNIKDVIELCKKSKIVNEIIVVNNLSTDNTQKIAEEAGAKVILCNKQGKGYAMKCGLKKAKNKCIVFIDGDIKDYGENIIELLAAPILENRADFVKSDFDRECGRVTILVAKPLLSLLFPNIPQFNQPLSGMIAGKKDFFDKIEFDKDYGVDIGILLDMFFLNARIEEVYIGKIENASKEWKLLSEMSTEVMKAMLKRAKYVDDLDIKECG